MSARIRSRWPVVAAAATLLAGYVTLYQGSITLAPILLVSAYCVAIPLAIVRLGAH